MRSPSTLSAVLTAFIIGTASVVVKAQGTPRIIGGEDATINRYPYSVSLQQHMSSHYCGGSLIAPDLVLTAAHCPQPSRVFINPYKLTNEDAEEIAVGTSVDHPFYKSINDYDHDYKIIRLRSSSSFSPIKLNNITTIPTLQQVLRLVGWGRFDPDLPEASETLQELNNDYIPNEKCNRGKFKGQITKDMLCARGSNLTGNSCKGDSGGPLIIPGTTSDEDVQVGIASWGRGGDCVYAALHGNVYARVSEEFDWIRVTACAMSDDPPQYFDCNAGATFSPAPSTTHRTEEPTAPSISPAPSYFTQSITIVFKIDEDPSAIEWKIQEPYAPNNVVYFVPEGAYNESYSEYTEVVQNLLPNTSYTLHLYNYAFGSVKGEISVYLGKEINNDNLLLHYNLTAEGDFYYVNMEFITSIELDGGVQTHAPTSLLVAPSSLRPSLNPVLMFDDVEVLVYIDLNSFCDDAGWKIETVDGSVVYEELPGTITTCSLLSKVLMLKAATDYIFVLLDSKGNGIFRDCYVYLGTEEDESQVLAFYNFTRMSTAFNNEWRQTFRTNTTISIANTPSPSLFLYPTCNICELGYQMTEPNAVDPLFNLTCNELSVLGSEGLITNDLCPFLAALVNSLCGCKAAQNLPFPSPAPSNDANKLSCLICGEGSEITIPSGVIPPSQGLSAVPMLCASAEEAVAFEAIDPLLCSQIQAVAFTPCGCITSTEEPSPTFGGTAAPVNPTGSAPSALIASAPALP